MKTFSDRVYCLLTHVPRGRVTTYKALAEGLGTHAYRAVGQALRNNPYAPVVPCHRVVASDGTIGGFMGNRTGRSIRKKKRLLISEGVKLRGNTVVGFFDILYTFR